MPYRHLFQPIKIGNVTIKNRLVMTAHVPRVGLYRYLRYLEERARGGVGLIIVNYLGISPIMAHSVTPPPHFVPGYVGDPDIVGPDPLTREGKEYYDSNLVPIFQQQAEIIHRHGAVAFGQLVHMGSYQVLANWQPVSTASPIADPFRCEVPHELDVEEIQQLVTLFGYMARLIKEGGLDGIEINAVHGLLLNEFMTPYSNHRTDKYGGSLENRLRIIFEIIEKIKGEAGQDCPVGLRIPGDEFVKGGLSVKDMQEIARRLAPVLSYLSISGAAEAGLKGGVTIPSVPPWYVTPGVYAPLSAAIREVVNIPTIVNCRINDPVQAENILADGQADMIGMARAFIADPEFPKKAREGREDDIRKCIACNEGCRQRTLRRWHLGLPIGCTVNASVGREEEMEIVPASTRKKVLVVGGGPGGMEAARVAALRGHKVILCEKEAELGGQVRIFTRDPRREEFFECIRFLSRQVGKQPIDIRLNTEVTPELVQAISPDAVIVATGSVPYIPNIPGVKNANVLTSWEALRQEKEVGGRVVVVGGLEEHQAAPSIGELLADRGKEVEILSENMQVGQGIEWGTMHFLMKRLLEKKIKLSTLTAVRSIEGNRVITFNVFTRAEGAIEGVDTVILAMGNQANSSLYRALKGRVKEIYQVGDCVAPRRVLHAVLEGSRAGRCV